jgi:molybdate transport system substrate-binding protein
LRKTLLLLACLAFATATFGQELKLYAAAGVKSPMSDIAADFEAATGTKIGLVFDTAGAAEQRFYADPQASFLVTSKVRVEAAEKSGKLKGGITFPLGDTVAGFAAPPRSAKPDISTTAKFKAALLAAPSIAFSDPAKGATVGTHFMKVIETLGIKDEVLKKATLAADGIETMKLVLEGKVAMGITQISEIVQADKDALVGPFPPEFDLSTTYSLWYRGDAAAAVKDFAAYLARPASRARLAADGLRAP